jgi:N-acyl-D-amino-acid deacylase
LLASIALAVVGMLFAVRLGVANDNPTTTVLLNAQVADGTGKPVHKANVRISGDRIVRVGTFRPDRGETIIDAKGLVVAPGFIDIHNHSTEGIDADPLAETQIAQGITTVILGADGDSPGLSVAGWMPTGKIPPR